MIQIKIKGEIKKWVALVLLFFFLVYSQIICEGIVAISDLGKKNDH